MTQWWCQHSAIPLTSNEKSNLKARQKCWAQAELMTDTFSGCKWNRAKCFADWGRDIVLNREGWRCQRFWEFIWMRESQQEESIVGVSVAASGLKHKQRSHETFQSQQKWNSIPLLSRRCYRIGLETQLIVKSLMLTHVDDVRREVVVFQLRRHTQEILKRSDKFID